MCKDFAWSFSISLMLNNEGKHCTKLKAQGISMDFILQLKGARKLNFDEKCYIVKRYQVYKIFFGIFSDNGDCQTGF